MNNEFLAFPKNKIPLRVGGPQMIRSKLVCSIGMERSRQQIGSTVIFQSSRSLSGLYGSGYCFVSFCNTLIDVVFLAVSTLLIMLAKLILLRGVKKTPRVT